MTIQSNTKHLAITQIRIRKPQKAIGDHWKQWKSMKIMKSISPWQQQTPENCETTTKICQSRCWKTMAM